MCCVGNPSDQFRKMADTSIKALETMIGAIRPGIPAREPWAAWARVLEDNGFQGGFKRTGYSIGVCFPPDWGEGQIINFNRLEERLLEENMVFHIPSMVKVFGVADFGTSETVRVTQSGAEAVTNFERRLFVRQ
jgi:Xaa-Pro dipeptidase